MTVEKLVKSENPTRRHNESKRPSPSCQSRASRSNHDLTNRTIEISTTSSAMSPEESRSPRGTPKLGQNPSTTLTIENSATSSTSSPEEGHLGRIIAALTPDHHGTKTVYSTTLKPNIGLRNVGIHRCNQAQTVHFGYPLRLIQLQELFRHRYGDTVIIEMGENLIFGLVLVPARARRWKRTCRHSQTTLQSKSVARGNGQHGRKKDRIENTKCELNIPLAKISYAALIYGYSTTIKRRIWERKKSFHEPRTNQERKDP